MSAVLLDTHAWVWSFSDEGRLSKAALAAITRADSVHVSPISFFEVGQKVRTGKWPEMVPFAPDLADLLRDQGGMVAPFTPEICLRASLMDWDHRDPFDRLLAVTSLEMAAPLITRDPAFGEVAGLHLIW